MNQHPVPTSTQSDVVAEDTNRPTVTAIRDSLAAGDVARVVSRLDEDAQSHLLTTLPPDEAADVLEAMPDVQAAELIEQLDSTQAAAIVREMASDEQADLLGDIEQDHAEAILAELSPAEADRLRYLGQYADDVAGGLMVTEVLAYPGTMTVAELLNDLRKNVEEYRDYEVQYVFVTDSAGKVIGVLRLRDVLLAQADQVITALAISDPITVTDQTSLEDLSRIFDAHSFLGLPVVDDNGVLLGLIRRSAVEEALGDRSDDDYRKSLGIVKEELRTMPVWTRSRRRLAWLSVNILLNVIAASVIAVYQDTLRQVIALAVFLPIISDMSGCSGNQAVAVSMRELALGLVRPSEVFRVLLQEVVVGLINGLALGLLIAAVAVLWKGNPFLGIVVGAAMALNTIIAVCLGGTLPLLLKRLKMDPALASGPILTTVTDMCGFFIILNFATLLLPRLIA